jgi:hypothetical protein
VVLLQRLWPVMIRPRELSFRQPSGTVQRSRWLALGYRLHDVPNLPLPDHCHRLKTHQRSSRCPEAAETKPWAGQPFYAPMVLFHDVIQILDLAQPREAPQFAACGFR